MTLILKIYFGSRIADFADFAVILVEIAVVLMLVVFGRTAVSTDSNLLHNL